MALWLGLDWVRGEDWVSQLLEAFPELHEIGLRYLLLIMAGWLRWWIAMFEGLHWKVGNRMYGLAVLAGSLLVVGWGCQSPQTTGYESAEDPNCYPASNVVKDDQSAFHIDPRQPWRIEFGRGSGWHGLDTVKLDQTGHAVLHRLKGGDSWETATLDLPADTVTKVLEAVEANHLLELDKAYHAAVADGTQWVLCIQQQDRRKVVYFNNHFPDQIVRFARKFDEVLSASAGANLRWRAVPSWESRKHEQALWDSINP
jgi:hypothetical protein